MPKPTATTTEATEKPKRIQRASTPFDEARKAQEKLEGIELKRRAVIDALSDEAAAMLEALEELRAKQSIDVAPSSPAKRKSGPAIATSGSASCARASQSSTSDRPGNLSGR
jgi:hypothetical protein